MTEPMAAIEREYLREREYLCDLCVLYRPDETRRRSVGLFDGWSCCLLCQAQYYINLVLYGTGLPGRPHARSRA